ncbi:hypothetical protein HYW55_00450 [Candidatus Gottesmanbacteria bacterium]|nr:hypothetical protein [Candidatus Gottesmanbacteria bacterium]
MEDFFLRFGLTQKENTAFLELVKLGASPISLWAKHAGIHRSSMYVLLERLKSEGLVTTFIHKGVMHVQAIPMAELSSLLYGKEQILDHTKNLLEKYLPDLQKLEKTYGITPKVKFYEGKKRVEAMYEEILKERSFRAFFHPERVKSMMPEYFHKIPLAIRENHGSAQELVIRCKEADEYIRLYRSANHQIERLAPSITFSSDTIITKQKIFLVGYSENDVVATEIWNKELAQTQAVLFDLIWSTMT